MKILSALFSLLCLFHLQGVSQLTLQDSLVAWYPFDGDALDYSGNANNGILNGPNLTADRFGNPNSAYFFNGSSDFISMANTQNFKPDFPITISAWVKIDDYGNNVVFNNDFTLGFHRGFWLNIVNGNLYISYGNGGAATSAGRQSIGGTTLLQLNQWYHVAGIIRGMNDMELYLNGKRECGTYTGSGGQLDYSTNAGISGQGVNNNSYLHGSVDEIRFYSRDLDKSEIRILADFPPQDTTFCQGDSLQLDAGYGSLISWSPTSNLSCTNCPDPIASPIQSTVYTAITENTAGCPDTVDISIITKTCPTAGPCDTVTFDLGFSTSVNGSQVTVYDQSTIPNNAQIDVKLGDGNSMGLLAGDTITYTYNSVGVYTICIEGVLALGETLICSDTLCDTVEITSALSIGQNMGLQLFKVFPNPNQGQINIEFPTPPGHQAELQLYSINGKLLQRWALDNKREYQFILQSLPAGYYQLRVLATATPYRPTTLVLD